MADVGCAQILQSLLQDNGAAAQRLPVNWAVNGETQERGRMYQLQALLAALQVHAHILAYLPTQNPRAFERSGRAQMPYFA